MHLSNTQEARKKYENTQKLLTNKLHQGAPDDIQKELRHIESALEYNLNDV